jgi:urea transport system ATP-binding protein
MYVYPNNDPAPILGVENVTVAFGGFRALKQLNFAMGAGELRVVIGPNGAGKTTLLDVVTGKTRPVAGRVRFKGHDITNLPAQEIARRGVGRKFQTPNVFTTLTVLENLSLAARGRRGLWAALTRLLSAEASDRVHEILELIGLSAKAHRPAGLLAHGEKQWLELGMVMAQDPELLLIDEPVAGMTPRESERTGELLLAMARKHALLVIEHDMTFVRQIASKVTVLDDGMLLCEGTVDEVQKDPRVIQVYLGEDKHAAPPAEPRHPGPLVRPAAKRQLASEAM